MNHSLISYHSIKNRTCAPTNIIKPAINPNSWCWFFASSIDELASVKRLAIKNNIPEKRTNFFCWLFDWPKLIFRVDAHCPTWQPVYPVHIQVLSDTRVMWRRWWAISYLVHDKWWQIPIWMQSNLLYWLKLIAMFPSSLFLCFLLVEDLLLFRFGLLKNTKLIVYLL